MHQFEQLMLTVVRRVVTWDDYSLLRVHRRVDVREHFRDIREVAATGMHTDVRDWPEAPMCVQASGSRRA